MEPSRPALMVESQALKAFDLRLIHRFPIFKHPLLQIQYYTSDFMSLQLEDLMMPIMFLIGLQSTSSLRLIVTV